MRIVAHKLDVLELEVADVLHGGVQFDLRQRTRLARELQLRLFDVIRVEMQVAERVDEIARLQITDLRHHQRKQRVAGDVERDTQKNIRAALVKLATQFALADVKLKQRVTRRQRHALDLAGIPRADDESAAVGIFFDLRDDVLDLVDAASISGAPVAPLRAIDATEIAVRIRPFVPDRHAVVREIFDVRLATQEPEQLVDDGLGVDFLGGQQRKTIGKRTTHLRAEQRIRARARAVGFEFSMLHDVSEQIEILDHCGEIEPRNTRNTS